jgi:hypothetical protein
MAAQCAGRAEAEFPLVRLGMVGDRVKRIMDFDWLHERSDEPFDVVENGHLSSPEIYLMATM